jgi:hypothetical protein
MYVHVWVDRFGVDSDLVSQEGVTTGNMGVSGVPYALLFSGRQSMLWVLLQFALLLPSCLLLIVLGEKGVNQGSKVSFEPLEVLFSWVPGDTGEWGCFSA